MKKKLLFLLLLILCATAITALVAVLLGGTPKRENRLLVTSFYPVYLLTQTVAEGAEGMEVVNLTANHSGCLHDYTLKTQDMRLLSEAELFFINGGGMELFLTKAAKECRDLEIIDTSAGFAFLAGVEHDHAHGHAGTEEHENHEHGTAETEDHDHGHADIEDHDHEEAFNAHIWLDIDGYLLQLSRVEEALVKADPAQAELYHKNAASCREELFNLKKEYEDAKKLLNGNDTVVFHEGFVYLLRMLGIETLHCLPMDSETQISAGEAAEIVEECKMHGVQTLFVTEEFAETIKKTFGTETGCQVVVLEPLTGGVDAGGAYGTEIYLNAMRSNLRAIREAYGLN